MQLNLIKKGSRHQYIKIWKKSDLASLKSDVKISNIDKLLETTPIDLSKLSNLVKNDVVKKTVYDELVKKS